MTDASSCIDCQGPPLHAKVVKNQLERGARLGFKGLRCPRCLERRELRELPYPDEPVPPDHLTLAQVVRILGADTRFDADEAVHEQGLIVSDRYRELSRRFGPEASSSRAREEWLHRWLVGRDQRLRRGDRSGPGTSP